MAQPAIQTSFNSGEWSPSLNARVDIARYHGGAALLRNFFVDYRGGATASPGTKYILQTKSTSAVRIIPFQASQTVSYILEFGDLYIRPFSNGAPILETATTITLATGTAPVVYTDAGHGYANNDWVYVGGNYYTIQAATLNTFVLRDLAGNNVDTNPLTIPASIRRVYTLVSPYTAAEVFGLKFAQNVSKLVLCHPNHAPYELILTSAANWTIQAITFGSTVTAPTGQAVATTLAAGTWNYAYVITAVDSLGQESAASAFATLATIADIRTVAGTNTVTWNAVTGAQSYNIYKATERQTTAVPAGSQFGFVGNTTGVTFIDSNIAPDFSSGPPVVRNPFSGTGVQSIAITAVGSYGSAVAIPTVSFSGGGGSGATAQVQLNCISITNSAAGGGYATNDTITLTSGVTVRVTGVGFPGNITSFVLAASGSLIGSVTPTNPVPQVSTSGSGAGATFNITWGVLAVAVTSPGTGYGSPPTVTFSSGAATATAAIGAPSSGNPTVPGFFDQRLVLAGPVSSPQQFDFSQPGTPYNFNVNNPIEPDDAFEGTLVSGQLNTIQSLTPQPQGLIALSDRQAWLINGGSPGAGVDATNAVANAHIFSGSSGLQPIVAVDNILYVQSKGSIVRDLVFDYGKQVYTGTDISTLSSHLFYSYSILDWAWAEEPFKVVSAVRSDGILLTLTFLKEQELIAWAHRDTQGAFKSVATVVEQVAIGYVDALYQVVQRTINSNTIQYIERTVEQYYPTGLTDAWQVDAGIQYNGAAALTFTGAQHLAGAAVVGLATDDTGVVTALSFTMATTGSFTLAAPASPATGYTRVTVGLAYTPQLTTLQLDLGEPTIQGKMKKINGVTVRVKDTLGLQIGSDLDNLVAMKDLVIGNVGTATNELVTDLVTGDAYTAIDPRWTVPGQYSIQQSLPYPATILGVIPQVTVGDTKDDRNAR